MTTRDVVDRLLDEAWDLHHEDRYADMLRVATQAVAAAQELDDGFSLLVEAKEAEAAALRMTGEYAAAMSRYAWILSLLEVDATREQAARAGIEWQIANAHEQWVDCARSLPGHEPARLFAVIDAGEAYLEAVGRSGWRAGLMMERARVLADLRQMPAAIAAAEQALATKEPDSPGRTKAGMRGALGDLLHRAGRHAEAESHLDQVLQDPDAATNNRMYALRTLAEVKLATGRSGAAVAHANAALQLARSMGIQTQATLLNTLADAFCAAGDWEFAQAAVEQSLALASRLGTIGQYFAHRTALDLALALGDRARADVLLAAIAPLAVAMQRPQNATWYTAEVERRRKRLEDLEAG